jgi:hypothetical protein
LDGLDRLTATSRFRVPTFVRRFSPAYRDSACRIDSQDDVSRRRAVLGGVKGFQARVFAAGAAVRDGAGQPERARARCRTCRRPCRLGLKPQASQYPPCQGGSLEFASGDYGVGGGTALQGRILNSPGFQPRAGERPVVPAFTRRASSDPPPRG